MKFPVTISYRSSKVKIYAPAKNFAYYRISYNVAGKRRMQTFPDYPKAKTAAERIVREISRGSLAAGLTASQSQDAIAALERLEVLRQSTGGTFSLLGAVSEFVDVSTMVSGRPLREVAETYLLTKAVVKPKSVNEAVEEFLETRRHKSESQEGRRAQMSPVYFSNIRTWLRDFANTFSGTMVCDLTKELFNTYIKKHDGLPQQRRGLPGKSRSIMSSVCGVFSAKLILDMPTNFVRLHPFCRMVVRAV